MKCYNCNLDMKKTKETYHYLGAGLDNIFLENTYIYKCKCGEEIVSIPAIIQLNNAIARTLIKQKNCLTGKEIIFLRKNVGLDRKSFAEYIGINEEELSSLENNKKQIKKTYDRIIRLIYANLKGFHSDENKILIDGFKEINESNSVVPINIPVCTINNETMNNCYAYNY